MLPIQAIYAIRSRRYLRYIKRANMDYMDRIIRMLLILLTLVIAHSIAMMVFEKASVSDALWLSFTTITTVGYGDMSARTPAGRISTILMLYTVGISLLAQMAAEFFEYRFSTREKKRNGTWRWDMYEHILIINTPNESTVEYLEKLVEQIRVSPELGDIPIQILTRKFTSGLPSTLTEKRVVHYCGVAENNANLQAVNITRAKYIILIARDAGDSMSDSMTLDVLTRIKEIGTNAYIVAEVTQDENRARMLKVGADAVIRPVRAYPEFPVRSLVAPGTEQVLENLFTHEDDHMVRYDVEIDNMKWSEVVSRLISYAGCLAIANVNIDGVIDTNPLSTDVISGKSVICLVNDKQKAIDGSVVRDAINNLV